MCTNQLTLRAIAWARRGNIVLTGPVIEYRVQGMPLQQEAFIANFGGRNEDRWKILRVKEGISGEWMGNHETAEQALAEL